MARLFPSLEDIKNKKVKITEGEKVLLEFLNRELNDYYEVYFKPNINGDKPQIVIVREKYGIVILGVKEWDLQEYYVDESGNFRKKKDFNVFKSPFKQVKEYKNNLYNLHSESLLKKSIDNPKIYNLVQCGVYFHKENVESVKKELHNKCIEYKEFNIIGKDSLNGEKLRQFLILTHMEGEYGLKKTFDNKIYREIKELLRPNIHTRSCGEYINYSNKQIKLMKSIGESKKIKGVAGSGKTLILAQRAVNANIRTKNKILILINNATLKNYIYRKINYIKEEFNPADFEINNYHRFIKFQLNNLSINFNWYDSFSCEELIKYLEAAKDRIERYDAIFIDEVQDYKLEWLRVVKKYFLKEKGEYVVFGDEKQNIYIRRLEENKTSQTNIKGAWNVLEQSFRLPMNLAVLAIKFQKRFLSSKYNLDDTNTFNIQRTMWDESGIIEYFYFDRFDSEKVFRGVYSIISKKIAKSNEICIIGTSVEILKKLDLSIRLEGDFETEIAFESEEEYNKVKEGLMRNFQNLIEKNKYNRLLKTEIKRIIESRKYNFKVQSSKIKLATIESFKGLEISSLIVIIDNTLDISDELIYTGITRCTNNLFIINIANRKYDEFFKNTLT